MPVLFVCNKNELILNITKICPNPGIIFIIIIIIHYCYYYFQITLYMSELYNVITLQYFVCSEQRFRLTYKRLLKQTTFPQPPTVIGCFFSQSQVFRVVEQAAVPTAFYLFLLEICIP